MVRHTLLVLSVLALVVLGGAPGAAEPAGGGAETTDRESPFSEVRAELGADIDWELKEEADAVKVALQAVGLNKEVGIKSPATVVRLTADDTPFLNAHVTDRLLWHVVIRDCSLKLGSSLPGYNDRFVRTFDVFLDPADGRMVKIKSRWPKNEPAIACEPSAASAARQMTAAGNERYHGFPSAKPETSLADALDSIQRGGAVPLRARQIVAYYVTWSRIGKWEEPRAVWAITLRGIPGFRAPPGEDDDERYQARYIVDAATGEYLCATNVPSPDDPRACD